MCEFNSVSELKEYGKIRICLDEHFNSYMNRNKLATLVNTRFEVIDKWSKNKIEKLDLDILARICFVLNCEVSDVLKFVK